MHSRKPATCSASLHTSTGAAGGAAAGAGAGWGLDCWVVAGGAGVPGSSLGDGATVASGGAGCALGGEAAAGAGAFAGGLACGAGGGEVTGGTSSWVKNRGMTTSPASAARLIHADRLANVLSVDAMLACFP